MELTITDRLVLLQVLPKEGDIITIKIIKDLIDSLSFSEKELKDYSITIQDNAVNWDEKKAQNKKVEIGPKALSVIVSELEKLNSEKKLTIEHLPVYDKFLGE